MSLNDELQHIICSRLVQEFFKNFQRNSSTITTGAEHPNGFRILSSFAAIARLVLLVLSGLYYVLGWKDKKDGVDQMVEKKESMVDKWSICLWVQKRWMMNQRRWMVVAAIYTKGSVYVSLAWPIVKQSVSGAICLSTRCRFMKVRTIACSSKQARVSNSSFKKWFVSNPFLFHFRV